ncbi:alpha/beta-hydrolase [Cryphonectria parasitica EP155]|uniref:Carboxylic ester hydrolase n=1 Tax=Cryphonectria parasitica (strain ATCC 38755 / EP155) TaxID=660469 RepID=A0A9P4YAA4_CRYP1|nr:alpha/beta-hydrolase [Cryphonectria parasitica EP155]KAF3769304.1 alpha/beta-hydrolase [Cryphonectria parasitica EP155]
MAPRASTDESFFLFLLHLFLNLLSNITTLTHVYDAPIITLPNITLSGVYAADFNITIYRRIPFAASTAPPNRFSPPQPLPPYTNSSSSSLQIYNTNQTLPNCPLPDGSGSEDCLYLGIYTRPWNANDTLRPVVVVFHGGAYMYAGSAPSLNQLSPFGYPALNVSSTDNNFVLVYPNYRLGALGFLPGQAMYDDPQAALNPGLLDQRAALQWVQSHIANFGGDPHNVTIFGQSAGGGSVIAHALAANEKGSRSSSSSKTLFRRVVASSPFWPHTYAYNDPEAEAVYDDFVTLTGCRRGARPNSGNGAEVSTVECMRNLDLRILTAASAALENAYMYPGYVWAPVLDGSFLTQTLTSAVSARTLNADLVFALFNANEGESFVDPSLLLDDSLDGIGDGADGGLGTGPLPYNGTAAGFDAWLADLLPRLNATQTTAVKQLYPAEGTTDVAGWSWNTTFGRASYLYRDLVLACPAYWIASTAPGTGYLAQWTVPPANHVTPFVWYWNTIDTSDPTQLLRYYGYTGAIASFFETGDPNAHKLTNDSTPGVPDLTTGLQFITAPDGFRTQSMPILQSRCAFWLANAKSIPI